MGVCTPILFVKNLLLILTTYTSQYFLGVCTPIPFVKNLTTYTSLYFLGVCTPIPFVTFLLLKSMGAYTPTFFGDNFDFVDYSRSY